MYIMLAFNYIDFVFDPYTYVPMYKVHESS